MDGELPSIMSEIVPGETNASGARSRMCRSTLPSRLAISASELARPSVRSAIQTRAFAIARSRAPRLPTFVGRLASGGSIIPLAKAVLAGIHGMLMTGEVFNEFRFASEMYLKCTGTDDNSLNKALD